MFSLQPPNSGISVRTCQRCGKPLSPNEVYCDNCGVYNGLPLANSFNKWTPPPAAPIQVPQSSSPSNYYNVPQQGYGYSPSSPTITGDLLPGSMRGFPSGFDHMPQPPARRGNHKLGLIIGISILGVILISGAFLGYAFVTNKNDKTLSSAPTSVPTPTPSVKPLFTDSFDNNNSGWDLTSNPGKFSVQVGGGKMVLEDDNNKLLWEIIPGKTFSDFTLTVDAVLSKGDPNNGYGIYFRSGSSRDSQLGTYYRFELYGDGTYAIFKGVLDGNGNTQSNKLVGYNASASIQKQGIVNHIMIIAKGQSMTFIVNGQILNKITDNNYKSGSVALFVSNLPGSPPDAQTTFSHLAIYPV